MKKKKSNEKTRGVYTSTVEYDKLSKTHVFMNKIFNEAKDENPLFDLPMKVPGKKKFTEHLYKPENEQLLNFLYIFNAFLHLYINL